MVKRKIKVLSLKVKRQLPVIRSVDVLIFLRYTPSKRSVFLWVEKFMTSSMTWQKYKSIADAETTRGVGKTVI